VEHLFRLAGGLDSMILGESQILKQIKDAFQIAQDAQTAGKFFNRLFPAALRVGKRVRTLTEISKGCITPGQAALKLARQILGDLSQLSLLVIGSGKIAALTAQAFQEEKIGTCYVTNRTPRRAQKLVEKLGTGTAVPWSHLRQSLAQADLVVSSTGAVDPIVSGETMSLVQKERGGRPMVVVDLAIPRDFDPSVRDAQGVHLFNIDDLNQVIQENVDQRHAHIPRVEEIVREEIRVFQSWMIYSQVDPVLRHLVERFEQIRLGELQACISQFPPECHPLLDQLTSSLVKKLLHFPIEKLKSLRDLSGLNDTEVAFLNRLFLPGS
jgi:glutamyl-tRNA reductase